MKRTQGRFGGWHAPVERAATSGAERQSGALLTALRDAFRQLIDLVITKGTSGRCCISDKCDLQIVGDSIWSRKTFGHLAVRAESGTQAMGAQPGISGARWQASGRVDAWISPAKFFHRAKFTARVDHLLDFGMQAKKAKLYIVALSFVVGPVSRVVVCTLSQITEMTSRVINLPHLPLTLACLFFFLNGKGKGKRSGRQLVIRNCHFLVKKTLQSPQLD